MSESEDVTWLCGLPNSVRRGRFQAPDRDSTALAYARLHRYDPISVEHVGDGWYDITGEGVEPGQPYLYRRVFRVNRAPDPSRPTTPSARQSYVGSGSCSGPDVSMPDKTGRSVTRSVRPVTSRTSRPNVTLCWNCSVRVRLNTSTC